MSSEILIVGAGMVGVMTAINLAQRGEQVCVIDRDEPGMAASFGNAGVVSPWSITPNSMPGLWRKLPGMLASREKPIWVGGRFWPKMIPWGLRFLSKGTEQQYRKGADAMFALCRPSVALYREHLTKAGRPDLLADSYYIHAFRDNDPSRWDGLDYQVRREKGAELEWAERERLQEVEPALGDLYQSAVLIKGQARLRSPIDTIKALVAYAAVLGVRFVRADIADIRKEGDRWLACGNDAVITGEKLVVCAGVWSKKLLDKVGITLPLVAERGYHLEVPDSGITLAHSIMDMEAKTVTSSMANGLRVAGAAEFDALETPGVDWREALMRRQVGEMFPGINADAARFWMGRRPSLPDSLPVIGPIDANANLFGAFGHSHHGIMMAPMTGQVIADMVIGNTPEIDMAPYHVGRFG